MSWRDEKRKAREIVHDKMALPCWIVPAAQGRLPFKTRARLHTARPTATTATMGDIESQGYARAEATHTKLVFMRSEYVPSRNDVVVLEADEAYVVEPERPADDITVTVRVSKMEVPSVQKLLLTIDPPLTFPVEP